MSWRISIDLKSDASMCVWGSYQIDNTEDLETFIIDLKSVLTFLQSETYNIDRRQRSEGNTEEAA